MESDYTVLRIDNTDNGWVVVNNETGKRHTVFCNLAANSEADAIELTKSQPEGD